MHPNTHAVSKHTRRAPRHRLVRRCALALLTLGLAFGLAGCPKRGPLPPRGDARATGDAAVEGGVEELNCDDPDNPFLPEECFTTEEDLPDEPDDDAAMDAAPGADGETADDGPAVIDAAPDARSAEVGPDEPPGEMDGGADAAAE